MQFLQRVMRERPIMNKEREKKKKRLCSFSILQQLLLQTLVFRCPTELLTSGAVPLENRCYIPCYLFGADILSTF